MGQWSYFTQDTHERIVNGKPMHVVMADNKGNQYVEECYEGYGVFGGKDYFELLAEMNGYSFTERDGMFYVKDLHGTEHMFSTREQVTEHLRQIGINMAFDGNAAGMNPNVLHPSLTTKGWYCNGEAPEPDPDQGFPDEELWGDYYDFSEEDE